MKEIAYISLTPLGDVICCMNQLEHLKKIYAPCRITVFAIPLIAELMKNSAWVDEVISLKGGVHYDLDLSEFVPHDPHHRHRIGVQLVSLRGAGSFTHHAKLRLRRKVQCLSRTGSEIPLSILMPSKSQPRFMLRAISPCLLRKR